MKYKWEYKQIIEALNAEAEILECEGANEASVSLLYDAANSIEELLDFVNEQCEREGEKSREIKNLTENLIENLKQNVQYQIWGSHEIKKII